MIHTPLFKAKERHMESRLALVALEFIELNYDKKLAQLSHAEIRELDDFAFHNVGSVLCYALRHNIKRWERLHETTVDGGEYLRELNLREGED